MKKLKLRKLTTGVITLLFIWFALHSLITIFDGLTDDNVSVDVIVVLGNKVDEYGQPSVRLQARLDAAYDLYSEKKSDKVIVSGGVGTTGFDEAQVMNEYLISLGVDEADIYQDSDGVNTYRTAKNSKHIMGTEGFESVIVVTQYFHISRTKMAFRRFDIKDVYGAHAKLGFRIRDLYSIPREFAGFYKYLFLDYISN